MEIVIFIIVLYIIFKFNRPLTTLVKVVDKSAVIADDTIDTYANDIHIINAEKREQQKSKINNIGTIVTASEIDDYLSGKKPIEK